MDEIQSDSWGRLLTMAEAAERLNVKKRFIKHLLYERRLERIKIGKLVRIPEDAVNDLITRGYVPTSNDRSDE